MKSHLRKATAVFLFLLSALAAAAIPTDSRLLAQADRMVRGPSSLRLPRPSVSGEAHTSPSARSYLANTSLAQTSEADNVRFVGAVGGDIDSLDVVGNIAYVGEGRHLAVLDVSDPGSPTVLGRTPALTDDEIEDIMVANGHAYVACNSFGLHIVDVTDPYNPTEVSSLDTPGYADALFVDGTIVYVADSASGLIAVDVSDPTDPETVGSYPAPSASFYDIYVTGGVAYVTSGRVGLATFYVSDPQNITYLGGYGPFDYTGIARGVFVDGDVAYVADGPEGLLILDVSSPSSPLKVRSYDAGYVLDVYVSDSIAYVLPEDLVLLDVSNPAQPTEIGRHDLSGGNVKVVDGLVYLANSFSGMWIVNASDPPNPIEAGLYPALVGADGVVRVGPYLYTRSGSRLHVVNVDDPARPHIVHSYMPTHSGFTQDMVLDGDRIYMTQLDSGVTVVDVTDPMNPTEIGFHPTPGRVMGIAVVADLAYVADYDYGLRILDVADPTQITEISFLPTQNAVATVFVDAGVAYIGETGGLAVIDVTDPTQPDRRGFLSTSAYPTASHVREDTLYLSAGGDLHVLDISDPESPAVVGTCEDCGGALYAEGDYAYAAGGSSGLRVVDVADSTDPHEVGFYETSGRASDVCVSNDAVYLADSDGGLLILRYTGDGVTFSVSGRVLDDGGRPVPGVLINTEGDQAATTEAHGYYTVTDLITGTYALTPTLASYEFSPPTATVSVPPDATGMDFTALSLPGFRYDGPRALPDHDTRAREDDGKLSLGDHARVVLSFTNVGSETILLDEAYVVIKGQEPDPVSHTPGIQIWDGSSWGYSQRIQLSSTLSLPIYPSSRGYADFWIYVTNDGPEYHFSWPQSSEITVVTGAGEQRVAVTLAPIQFVAEGHHDLLSGSCLHTPSNYDIRMYAQYAAGACAWDDASGRCSPVSPPWEAEDPDSAPSAVRNLSTMLLHEFEYDIDGVYGNERVGDVTLLTERRDDVIGVCLQYADLTVGLLRSLGIPARLVNGSVHHLVDGGFVPLGAHGWAEAFISEPEESAARWRMVDSRNGIAMYEGYYWYEKGWRMEDVYADLYPLSSASKWNNDTHRCIGECYAVPPDCPECFEKSGSDLKGRKLLPWQDFSCVTNVTDAYQVPAPSAAAGVVSLDSNTGLSGVVQAPVFTVQGQAITVTSVVSYSSPTAQDHITAAIDTYAFAEDVSPILQVEPAQQTVLDLAPGADTTLTWVVTPVVSAVGMPLRLSLQSELYSLVTGAPLVVNAPGALPPVSLGHPCRTGIGQPGSSVTFTTFLLDEHLSLITDTLSTVTGTVSFDDPQGFSEQLVVAQDDDGRYLGSLHLPSDALLGTYSVSLYTSRPGYQSDTVKSFFSVRPLITATMSVTPTDLWSRSQVTVTAAVSDRGQVLADEARAVLEIAAASGATFALPFDYQDGFQLTFTPADLAPNLGVEYLDGVWQVRVLAEYAGGTTSTDWQELRVRDARVYLPLVMR